MISENEIKERFTSKALKFFDTLAPSYQKNYILSISSAKQESTLEKRLEEVNEALELECKHIFDYKKLKNPRKEIPKDLDDKDKISLYFDKIEDKNNKKKVTTLFNNILKDHSELEIRYAWNSPMITAHKTFIMGFNVAKNHFTLSFEKDTLNFFEEELRNRKYKLLAKTFQIQYTQEIDYELLNRMVIFSIDKKKDVTTFWK